jgi:glycosyltransferase involved in cell wall biosynthesis
MRKISLRLMADLRSMHERSCLQSVFGIVNLSEFMRRKMLDVHPEMESKAWRIIPGGADPERFHPASSPDEIRQIRKRLGLPVGAFIILTARRLVPRTGVDILLRAFKDARQNLQPDATLVICGDGVMAPELRKLASEMDLDRHVIFTGFVTEELLPDFYRAADLFVMPTKALEGFGLSTVEALACGLPVIGTDIGGTPEILGKISDDLLIRGSSVDAIAGKIAKFANPDAVFPLKEKSLICARENFTWDRHVRELMDFAKT